MQNDNVCEKWCIFPAGASHDQLLLPRRRRKHTTPLSLHTRLTRVSLTTFSKESFMAAESWDELETCLQEAHLCPAVKDLRRPAFVWAHVDQTCDDLATVPGGPRLFAVYGTPAAAGREQSERRRRSIKTKKQKTNCHLKRGVRPEPECSGRQQLHCNYIRFNWISRLAISDVRISMFTFCTSLKTLTPRLRIRVDSVSQPVCTRVTYFECFDDEDLVMQCFLLRMSRM